MIDGVATLRPVEGDEQHLDPATQCGRSRIENGHHVALLDVVVRGDPSSTTVPAEGAVTGISIFMDSRMTSSSPSATSRSDLGAHLPDVGGDLRPDLGHRGTLAGPSGSRFERRSGV